MTLKTDYCGNMIYENGHLSRILPDVGYITLNGTTPMYHYYLKDHLGNNRVVMNERGAVEQVNHYYTFGGLMGESTGGGVQPYKYNGKELDRMHGLDWYDYGARHYDAALGRWMCMDPLEEKYYDISSYAYCHNNPMNRYDPNGMDDYTVNVNGYMYNSTSLWERIKDRLGFGNNQDRIFMEGSNKLIATFKEGSIKNLSEGKPYTAFEMADAKDSKRMYDVLTEKTKVEWAKIGHDGSSTFVTDHKQDEVKSYVSFLKGYDQKGEKTSMVHNHITLDSDPYDNAYYLNPNGRSMPSPEDYNTAKQNPKTIFILYDQIENTIKYYNANGIYKVIKK